VDKKILLEHIKSLRPNRITIDDKLTKPELIRGLFEASQDLEDFSRSSTKDMIELHGEMEDGVADIRREGKPQSNITINMAKQNQPKETKVKPKESKPIEKPIDKPTDKLVDKPKDDKAPAGKSVQKTGLNFTSDLGFKAVALNPELKKLNEAKVVALKDMFTEENLKKIIRTPVAKWQKVMPKQFYCNEKFLEPGGAESSATVPCWRTSERGKVRLPNQVPKGYLNNYYTRMDENGGEKAFKNDAGVVEVPMGPRSTELDFYMLPLGKGKNVITFSLPNRDEIFIAPMSSVRTQFFFDIGEGGNKGKGGNPTPKKPTPGKNPETTSDEAMQQAGDLILNV